MSCKSQAHDALGLLFAREGVLLKMIVDNAKEMKLGEFARKCKEAIRELKKGAAGKLTWSGVPRWLRCFVLKYESYVCLHIAHDIYQLDCHVPKTVILGETADVSPFCEFGFSDWVKFKEDGVAFPDNQMVLGKYLGPSIDVGPAMTQHVMKANGEYEGQTTLHQLTPKELLLPVRDGHELARVLCRKHDANGVPANTAHKQPAMDTCVYEVHFPDGCTKELAVNTIAEALYAQCNPDGNQYVMLDASLDYRKNPNVAFSVNNQVKIVYGKKVVSCSTRE
ncbi:hypothetical protein ACHAW6_001083 [Cyclotella cf. meneghiniana]